MFTLFGGKNSDECVDNILLMYEGVDEDNSRASKDIIYLKPVAKMFRTLYRQDMLTHADHEFISVMGKYIEVMKYPKKTVCK